MIRTNFKPDANGVVTIPAPGSANRADAVARVNVVPGSRQVVPFVVTPAPQLNSARQTAGVQPVAANAPLAAAAGASASAVFDSLASRGEPPQLGANGKPIVTRAVAVPAAVPAAPAIARASATRPVAPAVAQQNLRPATLAQALPLPGQQDPEAIRSAALGFLQQQSAGLPGKVDITVAPAFPRGLAQCSTLEPFMPSGARLWGRMTVGVRCAGERPWTIYLQARISLHATYYLAARAMAPGEVLTAADLVARDGDLTGLPQAIVTDPSQAVGSVTLTRVAGGMPLRRDMLKSASAVSIGQTVRVVAAGEGFAISAEGSAMNNASPGQQVRVKTANGQIISGIVKDGSTVEIQL
jgi:flagella basal body P-ring formation protein FlgA